MKREFVQMETFLIIVVSILIIIFMIPHMGCPKCRRFFSKEIIAEKTLHGSPWGREEQLITYRCKNCDHVWKEKDDGSVPPTYPF
jgi:hypothetical protein